MKKIILTLVVLTCVANSTYSQKWENYFQFGVGTGYLMDADMNDTPFLTLEYGKTYKWFDLAGAIEYAPEYNKYTCETKRFISLVVKTKFDIVRMFTENSHHSFKLGTGIGVGSSNFTHWRHNDDVQLSANYFLNSVMASYEYKIVDKTWLGLFFNNYTEDNFFGLHYLGLSIRHNF